MLFKRKKQIIEYQKDLDPTQMAFCQHARLLYINGSGVLSTTRLQVKNKQWPEDFLEQVTLRGTPLWSINRPYCSTSKSLLAAGMGIERVNVRELWEVTDRLNSDYVDFDTAVDNLAPLLSLLASGLYIVADKLMCPTDGAGRFFWDVPNGWTVGPATAVAYLNDEDFECTYVDGEPSYLYPTQSVACYNEERARYYVDRLRNNPSPPRAIVYHGLEWLSFLLDGHHKACAAALLEQPLHCLVIMPYQYGTWSPQGKGMPMLLQKCCFEGIDVQVDELPRKYIPGHRKLATNSSSLELLPEECAGSLGSRCWEEEYARAARKYPKVDQYAVMREAGVDQVTDESIRAALVLSDDQGRQKLRAILTYMQITGDTRLKKTALACADLEYPDYPRAWFTFRKYVFETLCRIKEDEEIEQFFIDWLAQDDDPHSELGWIAASYWN